MDQFPDLIGVQTATATLTPRRLQSFPRSPYQLYDFENRRAADNALVASGSVNADANGLIHVDNFEISRPGNILILRPNAGIPTNQPPSAVIIASPDVGAAPLLVQFTGSNSTDSDGSIMVYNWDFGDGESSTLADPQHTYSAIGDFDARLIVFDNLGASDTTSVQVHVMDCLNLPDANAYGRIVGGDQSHVDKVTYCFQGTAGNMLLSFQAYDIDSDSEVAILLNSERLLNVPVTGDNQWSGNFNIPLPDSSIRDGQGNVLVFDNTRNPPKSYFWGVRQVEMSPLPGTSNQPPIAEASAEPTDGLAPLTVQFTSSGSRDYDGAIVDFAWNFGDGDTASVPNPQHTYVASGTYAACLVVTDNQGASDTAFAQVQALDCLALPDTGAYGKIAGGDQLHADKVIYCFQGTAGDMLLSYQAYDIDTGTEVRVRLNGVEIFNLPTTANNQWSGTLNSLLPDSLVREGESNSLAFDNTRNPPKAMYWGIRQVTVSELSGANVPPTAVASAVPDSGIVPLTVQCTASNSVDVDGSIIEYVWDFGDGDTASVADPQHTYAVPGSYSARLIVTDDQGASDTTWVQIQAVDCLALPDTAAYGKIIGGDQSHADKVVYCFQGQAGDLLLSYQAYDVDTGTEVRVWLNDASVFYVPVTANNQWSGTLSQILPDSLVKDGQANSLVFDNRRNPPKNMYWGVRQVEVSPASGGQAPAKIAGSISSTPQIPAEYSLEQNYPNPFNPRTSISFGLPQAGYVRLAFYNSLGQPVRRPMVRYFKAGRHTVRIDASQWPTGVYFYELEVHNFRKLRKMILAK